MGGRPRPAVLRIAERGRRNILTLINVRLVDYNFARRQGMYDLVACGMIVSSPMKTDLSYGMGYCRGYYP